MTDIESVSFIKIDVDFLIELKRAAKNTKKKKKNQFINRKKKKKKNRAISKNMEITQILTKYLQYTI